MKWHNDPLKYEKYLIFDAIIKFAKETEGESFSNISIRRLSEFVDEFLEDEYCTNCKNENIACVCLSEDEDDRENE